MAAVRPYLLTDQNRFRTDTSRHSEEFIYKVTAKLLQWFRRRCNNGENQGWPAAAIFVDPPEPYSGVHNYTTDGRTDVWTHRRTGGRRTVSVWVKLGIHKHVCACMCGYGKYQNPKLYRECILIYACVCVYA